MRRARIRSLPRPWALAAVLALAVAAASPLAAQGPPAAAGMREGRAALEANDLQRAKRAFRSVVDADPGNAEAWFQLGLAERGLGEYDAAIRAFGSALDKGYSAPTATVSLAITYVAKKDFDKALEYLDRGVRLGVPLSILETHPGLAAIRGEPRFQALLAAADRAAHPCDRDPRYRAFDFWLGDWDVYARGQLIGANHVERVARGCALLESWTGAGGSNSGRSLSYYDPGDGKWRQNWVGDGGDVIAYEGGLADGAIRMTGETRLPDGSRRASRGAWTPRPDGGIRQLLETSPDGGKSWSVAFDGIYVKKGSAPPAGR